MTPQTHLYIAQPEEKTVTEAEGNLSSDLWEAPIQIQIQILLFPIKEPFRAEQLTKNLIQWLWIDYIDWKMTTFYETNKSNM